MISREEADLSTNRHAPINYSKRKRTAAALHGVSHSKTVFPRRHVFITLALAFGILCISWWDKAAARRRNDGDDKLLMVIDSARARRMVTLATHNTRSDSILQQQQGGVVPPIESIDLPRSNTPSDGGPSVGFRQRTFENTIRGGEGTSSGSPHEHGRALAASTDEADGMSVTVSFEDIIKTIVFICAAWALGNLGSLLGLPTLVGEIIAGFLLGPPLADFVPFPEAMVLIGSFGLIGLILESGIDIDVAQLMETGKRAVLLAVSGTVLALGSGLGLGLASSEDFTSALAVGAAFSPSSFGVISNVLSSGEVLNTPVGQLIVASSVVDDVLGLVLLSVLQVFVMDNPKPLDFVLPFISSFGYLIVLGYSGITWIPWVITKKIMPLFSEEHREKAGITMMFFMLIAYLPLLNYSRASYLTGAFLTGLSFSQINSVHASYARNTKLMLNWLMRIFFAATIGFQVPIKHFSDGYVLKWGANFLVPILAKMPLSLLVPRFRQELPDDFPYDPYWRDVLITALSITCRGEFNFIIASFALSAGFLNPDLYAAVIFAVLLSSIVGPLVLSHVIRHYNDKSRAYMSGKHPVQRIGEKRFRPLFLAIQARTPIHWGLHDTFRNALESDGLLIIDHRSWHTHGLDAVDVTEIFVQDTKVNVAVPTFCTSGSLQEEAVMGVDVESNARQGDEIPPETERQTSGSLQEETVMGVDVESNARQGDEIPPETERQTIFSEEADEIKKRCDEVRKVLEGCLLSDDPSDCVIQVSKWTTYTFDAGKDDEGDTDSQFYCLTAHYVGDNEVASQDDSTQDSFDA